MGLHAVAPASADCPPGVIYVLKNRAQSINIDNKNRLHPFYMVYISEDGEVVCDYLQPCLLYTSPSPRDRQKSRMPSSA